MGESNEHYPGGADNGDCCDNDERLVKSRLGETRFFVAVPDEPSFSRSVHACTR